VADDARIAAALQLPQAEIGFGTFRACSWSGRQPRHVRAVGSLRAVGACRPDLAKFATAFDDGVVYVFCDETAEPGNAFHGPHVRARVRSRRGSGDRIGCGRPCRASWPRAEPFRRRHCVRHRAGLRDGAAHLIRLTLLMRDGKLASAAVGGAAVIVTEGTIEA